MNENIGEYTLSLFILPKITMFHFSILYGLGFFNILLLNCVTNLIFYNHIIEIINYMTRTPILKFKTSVFPLLLRGNIANLLLYNSLNIYVLVALNLYCACLFHTIEKANYKITWVCDILMISCFLFRIY